MVEADLFRAATRARASAVAIVTTRDGGGAPLGLAAALVMPVSNAPPEMLVALNHGSRTCAPLLDAGAFAINLLNRSHADLCRRFADPAARATRFADPVWDRLATGMPVLRDALAAFDCAVLEARRSGTHLLVTGSVRAARVAEAPGDPLIQYLGGLGGFAAP